MDTYWRLFSRLLLLIAGALSSVQGFQVLLVCTGPPSGMLCRSQARFVLGSHPFSLMTNALLISLITSALVVLVCSGSSTSLGLPASLPTAELMCAAPASSNEPVVTGGKGRPARLLLLASSLWLEGRDHAGRVWTTLSSAPHQYLAGPWQPAYGYCCSGASGNFHPCGARPPEP